MTCMFLGYAQNHTYSTHHMLILRTKRILLSRDVIWLNKTYVEYVSKREHSKDESNNLQYKYQSTARANVKNDPTRTEVNTEYVKNKKSVDNKQDNREEEYVKYAQKNIKTGSFKIHKNQFKQDNHEYINESVILALNNMYTSYNTAYLNYTNEEFNYIMLEDTPEEKNYSKITRLLQCAIVVIG